MTFTDNNKQDVLIAWAAAILIHLLFFSLIGKMFLKPPQFTITPTREIDINLIAEPKEVIQVQEIPKPKIISKPIVRGIEKSKQFVIPKKLVMPKVLATPSAQVKVEAKPDYIQNPPPPYPELARQMHQEGLVMLSVDVDKEGDPVAVAIIQSSEFRMLDQVALKTVRHWKFQPGSVGGIPVDSTVTVPIRFRLEKGTV